MGNSIIGKMVVMMVGGGVEGRGGGGRLQQHSRPKCVSPSFGCRTKYINPVGAGVPRWSGVFVVGVTQTECEPLRGAAPRGVADARQLSPASQGLLELCVFLFFFVFVGERGKRERVCVCKNVDVREAQREAFPFIVAAYRMRKSPECTRRTLLRILTAKSHQGNTCICKQALCETDHPSSGEVFRSNFLLSLNFFIFFFILPITTLLTFPQTNVAG